MAKRQTKADYSYKIIETIGSISEPNPRNNWCKALIKTLLNDDEEGVDIRRMDMQTQTMSSSGIRLNDDEVNRMVDLLLQSGYGSSDVIEEAYKNRRKLFYGDEEEKQKGE